MTRYLFFYGTLMSGGSRAHVIDGLAAPVGPAATRGKLFSVNGYFPALIDGHGIVHGELWEARSDRAMELALRSTDMIEGYREGDPWSLYRREQRELLAGPPAWTYIWNGNMRGLSPIPDGRWRRRVTA